MITDEGYIKFDLHWTETQIPHSVASELMKARDLLHDYKLIGVLPDGIGFGNISMRADHLHRFIISGTQTGQKFPIRSEDFCLVTQVDILRNALWCTGIVKASSESLSHAAIYQADPDIQTVIHVHNHNWWVQLLGNVPTTPATITYGTPEMAQSLAAHVLQGADTGIIACAGHADGIFIYGRSLDLAMQYITRHAQNWSTNNG